MATSISEPLNLNDTERAALELIWFERESSRIALSDRLGISRMHSSNIVKGLLEKQLIADLPLREGARGQPVRVLTVAEEAAFAIGIKVWRTRLEIGVLNAAGVVKHSVRVPLSEFTVSSVADAAASFFKSVVRKNRSIAKRIVGIGFAFPGYFNRDGKITQAYFPEWDNLDVASALQQRFGVPVLVENDGACAAWGERLLGAATALDDFLFIDINYGVGGGVVMGGRLLRGAHGNAGVFGVPFPVGTVRPSGQDLIENLRAAGLAIDDLPDLEHFPMADNPAIGRWIKRAADQLRPVLGVLAGAFDPTAIIIGGAVPKPIIDALAGEIDNEEFCQATRQFLPIPKLLPSSVDSAGVAGSAALAMTKALFPRQAL